MVPFRCSKRELGLVLPLLWEEGFQVVPLVDVCASDVLDLACANDGLSRLVSALSESCNIWYVHAEDIDVGVLDFFKPFESWEECAPKRVSTRYYNCNWVCTRTYDACTLHPRSGGSPNRAVF
jgi:hypothetical protein